MNCQQKLDVVKSLTPAEFIEWCEVQENFNLAKSTLWLGFDIDLLCGKIDPEDIEPTRERTEFMVHSENFLDYMHRGLQLDINPVQVLCVLRNSLLFTLERDCSH